MSLKPTGRTMYLWLRRAFDVGVVLVVLPALVPVLSGVALAVRLGGGPGPVLFLQQRRGLGGRIIVVPKFRTMVHADHRGHVMPADSRVTPLGRILRRYHFDELPQLLLVLTGTMSLVGPRPLPLEETDTGGMLRPDHRLRCTVRPGLTGLAQWKVGYVDNVADERRRLRYDDWYVRHRGPCLDGAILWATIGLAVRGR